MAAIDDLISQIQDAELRDRIQKEVNKLSKQKKFGLVFEEHLPECTPLFDMPIKRGCKLDAKWNTKAISCLWATTESRHPKQRHSFLFPQLWHQRLPGTVCWCEAHAGVAGPA